MGTVIMIDKEQALLALVMDRFAEKFDKKAVLRGGMVLRILGSPRSTNDLDYIFAPFKSKNDIVDDIVSCLKEIEGANVTYSLNSKCLRVVLTVEDTTIQVEVKVAKEIAVSSATTNLFSPQFDLPKRIINIVDLSVALSNKMAAWNERRLIRDIYDIWFYIQMNVQPDIPTLQKRINKPQYSKLVNKTDYFQGTSASEFFDFLRDKCADLSDKEIEYELSTYLPPEDLQGLGMMFRAALAKLIALE